MESTVDFIARVCHEVNKAYCEAIGDFTQLSWADAPEWQRESARKGVQYALDNPTVTPEQMHQAWMGDKIAAGWVYGEVKDPHTRTHPCLVPYAELPERQRTKDHLFRAVVQQLGGCD